MVAALPREANALVHQAAPDAEAARGWLDEQEPEFGDAGPFRMPNGHHRSHVFAIAFGDPAPFVRGVEIGDKVGNDARDERLEALVPAVFIGVEHAVPPHHPPEVAGACVRSKYGGADRCADSRSDVPSSRMAVMAPMAATRRRCDGSPSGARSAAMSSEARASSTA